MSNMNETVEEVVLYKVNTAYTEKYAETVLPLLQKFLKNQDGFLAHKTLGAIKQDGYMLDLIEWSSLSAAEAASAEWKKRTESGEFAEVLAAFEKVEFFDHFKQLS